MTMSTNEPLPKYVCVVVEVGSGRFDVAIPGSIQYQHKYWGKPYVKVAGGEQFDALREFHQAIDSVVQHLEQEAASQPVTLDSIAGRLSERGYSCKVYGVSTPLPGQPKPKSR